MTYISQITQDTIVPEGKHKFTKLSLVPMRYWERMYEMHLNNKFPGSQELLRFVKWVIEKPDEIQVKQYECPKVAFPNKKEANFRANKIRERTKREKYPIRSYECPKCGAWHLTSKRLKDYKTEFSKRSKNSPKGGNRA